MSGAGGFPDRLFAGRRYAVVGLGRNGLPVAERLTAIGADVVCWDDGEAGRTAAVAAGLDVAEIASMAGFAALVLSPGIAHAGARAHPVALDAIARGVPVLSDAALLFETVRLAGSRARFVGITGTNGKSTTTMLLRHLLTVAGIRAAAGGNLGPAALALPLLDEDGVYVLEMSSYMLERVPGLHLDAAALLNISPDHLERHGGMTDYIQAKRMIFAGSRAGDLAVVGVDDDATAGVAAALDGAVTVSGAMRPAAWHVRDGLLVAPGRVLTDLLACPALRGSHNHQNAAAASAIASFLGLPDQAIATGLRSFEGLDHRQKRVATVAGVAFVDDSKATNADAAARALDCAGPCIWIAGGLAKEGGIATLGAHLREVAEALLIGRDADAFAETIAGLGIRHRVVRTLEAAVPIAFEAARSRAIATVLLSPAAASFDQFADFEERGRRFADLARALDDAHPRAA